MNSSSRVARLVTSRKTMISAAAVAVLLVAASVWWFGFASKAGAATRSVAVQSLTVSTRTLQETVSGTGTLSPTVDDEVSFAASGTVTAVKVKEGQTVKAGDVLATITTTQAAADLASTKATLASAQADLAEAESSSTGSDTDVDTIESDEAAVTSAKAAVTSAQAEVDGTTLTSPAAGIVAAVNIAVGDQVSGTNSSSSSSSGASSGSSGSGGTSGGGSGSAGSSTASSSSSSSASSAASSSGSSSAAFEITGTDSWTTSISVSASAVKNIKVGDQVKLSTTENSSFYGTVSAIGLLPSTSSGAATYPVTVDVTGSPDDLYDGVSVTADVIYRQITDAVAVPSLAITRSGSVSTVKKVVNGKAVTTTVTTGLQEDDYTQITKGLSSGDTIQITTARPGAGSGGSGSKGTSGGSGLGGAGFGGGTSGGSDGAPGGAPGGELPGQSGGN